MPEIPNSWVREMLASFRAELLVFKVLPLSATANPVLHGLRRAYANRLRAVITEIEAARVMGGEVPEFINKTINELHELREYLYFPDECVPVLMRRKEGFAASLVRHGLSYEEAQAAEKSAAYKGGRPSSRLQLYVRAYEKQRKEKLSLKQVTDELCECPLTGEDRTRAHTRIQESQRVNSGSAGYHAENFRQGIIKVKRTLKKYRIHLPPPVIK